MSVRPRREKTGNNSDTLTFDPDLLRNELDLMRSNALAETAEAVIALPAGGNEGSSVGVMTQAMRDYDNLSPTEQQAASLGVHPEAFRPLKELNEQHFAALKKANALSPQLEANIKAFQAVAAEGAA